MVTYPLNVKKYALGFSLIEIMIALAISLILLAGVITIMSSSKKTYTLQSELARLQENARFAIEDIAYGSRMAGYAGCSGVLPDGKTPLQGSKNDVTLRKAVEKSDGTYELKTASLGGSALSKSDVLSMVFFNEELKLVDNASLLPPTLLEPDANQLKLDLNAPGVEDIIANTSIILSDCGGTAVYKVKSFADTPLTSPSPKRTVTLETEIGRSFNEPIEAFAGTSSISYEVAWMEKGGQESFGLFSSTNSSPNYDLIVEGVRTMQINYSIEDGAGKVKYINFIPNGAKATTARVNLLMRTIERRFDIGTQLGKGEKTLKLPGKANFVFDFEPEEGYRYRFFSTLAQVRNSQHE